MDFKQLLLPDSSSERNMGLKRRHGICTAKPTFDMIGPLHVDVFNQSKYMLNGVTMKVRMTRSKDSFVLMAKSDVTKSQNCLSYLFNTCLVNTVFPELDGPETIIDQGCLNRVSNSTSIIQMINNADT